MIHDDYMKSAQVDEGRHGRTPGDEGDNGCEGQSLQVQKVVFFSGFNLTAFCLVLLLLLTSMTNNQ